MTSPPAGPRRCKCGTPWPPWRLARKPRHQAGRHAAGHRRGARGGLLGGGVALTGNIAGLDAKELAALDPQARDALRRAATDSLLRAGAHLVVDSAADLPGVVQLIEGRLAAGEGPGIVEASLTRKRNTTATWLTPRAR